MAHNPLEKFLGFILLTLLLMGCSGMAQDIKQEIKDDRREAKEKMEQAEKSYEQHKYFGLSSTDSDKWNSTDWTLWMDAHGGGR